MYTEDYLPYDDGIDEGRLFNPEFPDEIMAINDLGFDDFGNDEEMTEEDEFYAWWKD